MSRIILDTNVCLDLLLFADPAVAPLADALRSRRVIAMANTDTRSEWIRVLGYPALRLDADRCRTLIDAFDALVESADDLSGSVAAAGEAGPRSLPHCSDPDDQKFLELARDTGARWLLSRDSDLLTLASRCRRDGLFSVLTPHAWVEQFASTVQAAASND